MNCGYECYQVGGPWIAENPACPVHGAEAQQREWVGLTDEEVMDAYVSVNGKEWCLGGMDNAEVFYDAIEAKLKEKNNG